MALEEDLFDLEYVSGGVRLPAWGTASLETFVFITVLNIGNTPAVTRAIVLAGVAGDGTSAADRVFDSDVDFDTLLGPFTGEIEPREEWFTTFTLGPGAVDEEGTVSGSNFWFRILATSPNLIPSVEIVSQDGFDKSGAQFLKNFSVVARYTIGDFSVFHRRRRIVDEPPGEGPIISD